MCYLMYKEVDSGEIWGVLKEESTKLRVSRLEQVVLPLVFHTEENNVLKGYKMNATMADHLLARGRTHFRKS